MITPTSYTTCAEGRLTVFVGLSPHRLGLRFHTCNTIEHGHGSIEHTKGALYLDGKVYVPRAVVMGDDDE